MTEIEPLVNSAFEWRKSLNAFSGLAVQYWILGVVFWVVALAILGGVFANDLVTLLSNPEGFGRFVAQDPGYLQQLVQKIIAVLAFLIPWIIVFGIVMTWWWGKVVRLALDKTGLKPVAYSFGKGVRLWVLGILVSLAALFSWYNKRFLIVLGVGILGIVLSAFPPFGTMLGWALVILGFLVYILIIVYNSVRLAFAPQAFVYQNLGYGKAMELSWGLTQKRAGELVLASVVLAIVIGVAGWVGQVLLTAILTAAISFAVPSAFSSISSSIGEALAGLIVEPFVLVSWLFGFTRLFNDYLVAPSKPTTA